MTPRRRLVLTPIGHDPEVGRWLAALEDSRDRTLKELQGVTPDMVDWYPDAPLNSIGSLLYHIALIEADWVATEMLGLDEPPELAALLPWPDREPGDGAHTDRHLSRIDGQSLEQHLERLASIRRWALEHLAPMTSGDFHRVRPFPEYDASADWAMHHVLQHEAEHRAHICWLRDTYPALTPPR
jgi:hypothetical protein